MDFSIPPDLADLRDRTHDFIRNRIIPLESDTRQTRHGPSEDLRRELNALARDAGLLAPHVGEAFGGLGLSPYRQSPRLRTSPATPCSVRSR